MTRHRRPRTVLWGARRGDRQFGGADDMLRARVLRDMMRVAVVWRSVVEPTMRAVIEAQGRAIRRAFDTSRRPR